MQASPSALPSGTVTFLFSDIEGSTRLLRELGAALYGTVLEQHNRLLREHLAAADGVEIDRQGDSFFFAFRSAGAAVAGAIAVQRALAEADWPREEPVAVRVGIHTGEATITPNGYVGLAVHQAARVGDVGHGGQVLLSATSAALVEYELPADVKLRDLGEIRLQGVDRPQRLHQLVVEGLPSGFPALGARPAAAAAPATAGPLLERDAEVAAIRALVDSARSGSGRLIAFEGRAGIGKTRLVAEARAAAEAAGFAVLAARGGELEHDFAWGVVRQLFEPLLATNCASERADLLGGAAALAAPLFDEAQLAAALESGDATFSLLHGLYWLVANQTQRGPTLIAIDDLQWADGPTLRWLTYLAHRLEGLPLLVVAGLRPPEQSRESELLAELLSDPASVVVRPGALSLSAVRALVHELYGVDPDAAFVSECHAATGGNPLFVRALVDTLKADHVEPVAANVARVRETGPEPVSRVVALRLARLPSEANALARAVAVLGDGAELEQAARLAELERELAGHAATTLARADLMRIELPLEFVHPVVRAAVYDRIPPNERPLEHRRAARMLAEANVLPEQVAAHLLLAPAEGDQEALATLRAAAERAIRRGAPESAVEFLQRALDEAADEEQRTDVLVELGLAERRLDVAAAARHFTRAMEHLADPARRGQVSIQLGRCLMRDNRHREAIPVFQAAIAELPEEDARHDLLTAELISAAWWEPDLNPIAVEALAGVDPDKLAPGLGRDILCSEIAYYEARRGVDRNRSLEFARRSITPTLLESEGAVALLYTGYTLTLTGCYEEAEAYFAAGLDAARKRGDLVTLVGLSRLPRPSAGQPRPARRVGGGLRNRARARALHALSGRRPVPRRLLDGARARARTDWGSGAAARGGRTHRRAAAERPRNVSSTHPRPASARTAQRGGGAARLPDGGRVPERARDRQPRDRRLALGNGICAEYARPPRRGAAVRDRRGGARAQVGRAARPRFLAPDAGPASGRRRGNRAAGGVGRRARGLGLAARAGALARRARFGAATRQPPL
jgi:class 3 adenylate cyclase/tetratricopeptide (TPR) repeat protein